MRAFCPTCGQEQSHTLPTVREWTRETLRDLGSLDGSLFRTLSKLASPGALTAEWLAGRRERYVRPFRLYLLSLAFFALMASVTGERGGPLPWHIDLAVRGSFVLHVPLITVAVYVALRRATGHSSLLPALVFSLHIGAFFVFVESVLGHVRPWAWNNGFQALSTGLLWMQLVLVQVLYFFAALRRAYSLTIRQTLTFGLLAWVLFSAAVPYSNRYFPEAVIALFRWAS